MEGHILRKTDLFIDPERFPCLLVSVNWLFTILGNGAFITIAKRTDVFAGIATNTSGEVFLPELPAIRG
jgi:hypothetical protein